MQSKYTHLLFLVPLFAFGAGCGSDSEPCRVADACVSRCAEVCGDRGVALIACTGDACNCTCGDSGAGGAGGTAGMGGTGGALAGNKDPTEVGRKVGLSRNGVNRPADKPGP